MERENANANERPITLYSYDFEFLPFDSNDKEMNF